MTRLFGYFIIILFCLITLGFWLLSKINISLILSDPFLSFSQALALLAVILISLNMVLSTRLKWIEDLFGGLDKVYQVHRFSGGLAFIFIISHPLLLVIKTIKYPTVAANYLLPNANLVYDFGIVALYLMILAFLFIVFIKIPYHLWKLSHRLLGLAFLLGFLHVLFIDSDVSRFLMLRVWILAFVLLGLASAFYMLFLYKRLGPKFKYIVDKIDWRGNIVNIWLKPLEKKITFEPGQFAFVRFLGSVGEEMHPFSFSSANSEEMLRFSIKVLGDYTAKLSKLTPGVLALLYGPYGSFSKTYRENLDSQVWIAGGIGVTPFLSLLRSEYTKQAVKKIIFFYCVGNIKEAVFASEINEIVKHLTNVTFIIWSSEEKGRITAKEIIQQSGLTAPQSILLCAPLAMMEGLTKQFQELGIQRNRIVYEKFQII